MEKVIEKKYILTDETVETFGHVLHRIKAIKSFGYLNKVEKGQLGGWVEKEDNLSQQGNCWIFDNAIACGNSKVRNNAEIRDRAVIEDNAII